MLIISKSCQVSSWTRSNFNNFLVMRDYLLPICRFNCNFNFSTFSKHFSKISGQQKPIFPGKILLHAVNESLHFICNFKIDNFNSPNQIFKLFELLSCSDDLKSHVITTRNLLITSNNHDSCLRRVEIGVCHTTHPAIKLEACLARKAIWSDTTVYKATISAIVGARFASL